MELWSENFRTPFEKSPLPPMTVNAKFLEDSFGITVVRLHLFFKIFVFCGDTFLGVFWVADHEYDIIFLICGTYEQDMSTFTNFCQLLPWKCKLSRIYFSHKNLFLYAFNEYESDINFRFKISTVSITKKMSAFPGKNR